MYKMLSHPFDIYLGYSSLHHCSWTIQNSSSRVLAGKSSGIFGKNCALSTTFRQTRRICDDGRIDYSQPNDERRSRSSRRRYSHAALKAVVTWELNKSEQVF